MKKHNKAIFFAWVAALSGAMGAVSLSGCGGGGDTVVNSPTRSVPEKLYGTWRLVSVSGGITGRGYPVTEETRITFNRGDRFQVVRTSPFFGGNLPVIEFLPIGSRVNLVIMQLDATRLGLAEEAADGYGYTYERVP